MDSADNDPFPNADVAAKTALEFIPWGTGPTIRLAQVIRTLIARERDDAAADMRRRAAEGTRNAFSGDIPTWTELEVLEAAVAAILDLPLSGQEPGAAEPAPTKDLSDECKAQLAAIDGNRRHAAQMGNMIVGAADPRPTALAERVGWQLVPIEPTSAMLGAGTGDLIEQYDKSKWDEAKNAVEELELESIWAAMIEAVPHA